MITPAVSNLLLWGSTDSFQTTGTTGLTYAAGLFTNTTTLTLPLLFEYSVFLNTTGSGMSCIGINGSSLAYGVLYNDNNCFTNSFTVLLPPGATAGIYYMDNGSPTVLTTSRLTITLLTAGSQGPTGTTGAQGPVGQVGILSAVPTTTQSVNANTLTAVLWGSTDSTQSVGITGLVYNASTGLFTNNTGVTLPVLVQYSLLISITGSGYSYIGITTATNVFTSYGLTYNDTNGFNNAYTVLLAPNASVGVYYTDNSATVVQTTSRVSLTVLTAGQQGPTGPIGQVAKLSVNPSAATQSIPSNSLTLVQWGSTIASQTAGNTGLTYAAGLFTNSTSNTLPILVDYSMFVSVTGGGYTVIGINGSTVYGGRYNDNIAITNSFTVLLSAGSTLGIYYMDNAATTLLNTSQLNLTVLVAGQQGPTGVTGTTGPTGVTGTTGPQGPVGQVAVLSVTPTASLQTITASSSLTLVTWGTTDGTQSTGITGLTYAAGLFTNTTSSSLPLLVEYNIFLNTTLSGYSVIGINGSTNVYGGLYNDSNNFTNSFTILLSPGATVGIYYMDNTTVTVQQSSRLTFTLLVAGPQGATGITGPTGPTQWGATGSNTLYYNGNVVVTGTVNSMTVNGAGTNTVVGTNALANNTTGTNNMVVGYNAGYTPQGFTGSNNIYLGSSAVPSSGAATNEIVIGQGATGAGSNTVTIGNSSTVSTTLFGNVRTFSYTVTASSTGYIQVIASSTTNNPLYNTSGIWLVSANATTITNPSGGVTLSATAYVATNAPYPSYANVFGGFSSSPNVGITGGTNTGAFTGYGIFLNISSSAAYGTYNVNFLRIN